MITNITKALLYFSKSAALLSLNRLPRQNCVVKLTFFKRLLTKDYFSISKQITSIIIIMQIHANFVFASLKLY